MKINTPILVLNILTILCFCGIGTGMYFWYINIYYKIDDCTVVGTSFKIDPIEQFPLKYVCTPLLLIDYEFNGVKYSQIKTKDFKYSCEYSNNFTVDEYKIQRCKSSKDSLIGSSCSDYYTTSKYPTSKDNCICGFKKKDIDEDVNSCCNYGYDSCNNFIFVCCVFGLPFVIYIGYFIVILILYMKEEIMDRTDIWNRKRYNKRKQMEKEQLEQTPMTNINLHIDTLNSSSICLKCNENITNVIFIPCGHKCICDKCCKKNKYKKCPVCNILINEQLVHLLENV
jgi:hypothetical protein